MIAQLIIAASGGLAIWLANDRQESRRKWAPIVGLIGQPFWLWETWHSGQLGMLALTVWYTLAWVRGFVQHWVYSNMFSVELDLGRLHLSWTRTPPHTWMDAWKGSNWRFLRIWRLGMAVYWPYERKA